MRTKSEKLDQKIGTMVEKIVKKYRMANRQELWDLIDLTCEYENACILECIGERAP